MPDYSNYLSFRKLVLFTVTAVYFLILVGGIVRSTGSGMGCPDWPKCFGKWVPPTNISQLPSDYKEHYAQKRKIKNERIASYLRLLNFDRLAVKISGDKSIYEELDFNGLKTWIEYLNRLTGAIIGLLIFAVLVYSFSFFSTDSSFFYISLLSFLTVGFEGWLGSIVVSTNLLPFSISVHMALALVLVGMLIFLAVKSDKIIRSEILPDKLANIILLTSVCIAFSFIQILLGTQVRENIDSISAMYHNENREVWVGNLGNIFKWHRSFSIAIFIANLILITLIYKSNVKKAIIQKGSVVLLCLLIFEIILGIVMTYFDIPSFTQPLHLFFGSLILGVQMFLLFYMFHQKQSGINSFSA